MSTLVPAGRASANSGRDIKGVGGGWIGLPPGSSAKDVQFSFSAHTGPLFASAIASVNRIAPVAQTTTRFPADELVRQCGEEWQGKLLSN